MLLKLKNRVVNNKEREKANERPKKHFIEKESSRDTYIYEVIKQS